MSPRRSRLRASAPLEATLFIAIIMWLVGFASVILGAIPLPNQWGVWLLALSGLILILGALVRGV